MNIPYTDEQIKSIADKNREIRKCMVIARDANESAIKLSHELDALHRQIESEHLKVLLKQS